MHNNSDTPLRDYCSRPTFVRARTRKQELYLFSSYLHTDIYIFSFSHRALELFIFEMQIDRSGTENSFSMIFAARVFPARCTFFGTKWNNIYEIYQKENFFFCFFFLFAVFEKCTYRRERERTAGFCSCAFYSL